MLLVYNRQNDAGCGCHDAEDTGLTDYGRAIVGAMNASGMVCCCTHTGERTAFDILEASTRPVVLSHSNPRALHDHPRNVSDDLMRAVAESGGVVGINGMSAFLGDGPPTVDAMLRHIDYAVTLLGPEHVGLALDAVIGDFDLGELLDLDRHIYPEGFGYDDSLCTLEPETLPQLVGGMRALGYGQPDIDRIVGGNWRRIAETGWLPS